ncbi:MAG: flavodoxin [Tannerella sp.]|jgi:flavodoxin I|nr:flavodoxin [Tannerella sp.]
MKKIGIFYGSTNGTTADIAQRIADKLDIMASDVHDISNTDIAQIASFEVLLLGSSTWGVGDLQDDWESFLPKLKQADLNGKAVALFGTGDAASFSDTFCDAVGTIYTALKNTGCRFCGAIPTEGYTYDGSTAEIDGKFVGLLLDEMNEDNLTDPRIDEWINQLKNECLA